FPVETRYKQFMPMRESPKFRPAKDAPPRPIWPRRPSVVRLKPPYVLLHGGLADANAENADIFSSSLFRIAETLQRKLIAKSSAIELCLAGVYELEEDPLFNAGIGSKLQSDGIARLSAAVMDGKRQRSASVCNLQSIPHPSEVAFKLLE